MLKTNYCKSVTDILYEEHEDWLNIENIVAKYYNMTDEDFKRMPIRIKTDLCKQFKTYIAHVRADFDEMGEMLISRKFNNVLCYKRATKKDEAYIISELNKNEKLKIRSKNRFDIRLSNVKKNNLLPKYKKLELDLSTKIQKVRT